jgi:hypothetical protein
VLSKQSTGKWVCGGRHLIMCVGCMHAQSVAHLLSKRGRHHLRANTAAWLKPSPLCPCLPPATHRFLLLLTSPFTPHPCLCPCRSILCALSFFHAALLERKKFGVGNQPGARSGIGWNMGYPFNTGDLLCCAQLAANYLDNNSKVGAGGRELGGWVLMGTAGERAVGAVGLEGESSWLLATAIVSKGPLSSHAAACRCPGRTCATCLPPSSTEATSWRPG